MLCTPGTIKFHEKVEAKRKTGGSIVRVEGMFSKAVVLQPKRKKKRATGKLPSQLPDTGVIGKKKIPKEVAEKGPLKADCRQT